MGKRAPKLPVASAGGAEQLGEEEEKRPKVAITDRDWQSIESAYGQKLSPQARTDIHEKTQKFVDRAEFERHAEPMSHARNRISTIIRAAGSLRSALDSGDHDADIYACSLIKKHLWKQSEAKKQKEGDAIKRRRRKKRDPLRNISSDMRLLIFRCQDALRELDDTKDQGFSKGDAWDRWIVRLTSIAEKHGLPWRVRKDSDKQSQQSRISPFVELVWELQQSVPKAHRRSSRGALAGAIVGARRQNRVG
jgi:hypothetical protein